MLWWHLEHRQEENHPWENIFKIATRWYTCTMELEQWSYSIHTKQLDRPEDHYVRWNSSDSEGQTTCFSYVKFRFKCICINVYEDMKIQKPDSETGGRGLKWKEGNEIEAGRGLFGDGRATARSKGWSSTVGWRKKNVLAMVITCVPVVPARRRLRHEVWG